MLLDVVLDGLIGLIADFEDNRGVRWSFWEDEGKAADFLGTDAEVDLDFWRADVDEDLEEDMEASLEIDAEVDLDFWRAEVDKDLDLRLEGGALDVALGLEEALERRRVEVEYMLVLASQSFLLFWKNEFTCVVVTISS